MVKKGENIYKRKDQRWEGRYIRGRTEVGKIQYGYVYGKKYNEVKLKLITKKAEYQQDNHLIVYDGPVETWLEYWLEQIVSQEVKESTYASYAHKVRCYIRPYFSELNFEDIDLVFLSTWIKKLEEKKLAASTVKTVIQVLKTSLKLAVHKGYLSSNPCEEIEFPKIPIKKIHGLSKLEQAQLEQNISNNKGGLAIRLSLYTGMRIGEISGLKWANIDFTQQIIHVEETLQRISKNGFRGEKTQVIVGNPKTRTSQRIIPFSNNLLYYLTIARAESQGEYVINNKGSYVEPRTITNQFKKILEKSGLKNVHFHMLRHTFVTRCIEENVDIASISKLLGHASIKMTLDIYADSFIEQRQMAMGKIDQLMLRP